MWDARFESVIRGHLPHLRPELSLEPDLLLAAHGLDSMGTIGLITALESEYALTLPDEAVTPANFVTARTVWDTLRPLIPATGPEAAAGGTA
ncbi:acyl carrier protein [Kitasatospora sp. CB02891]|uniref:acyl carrier protein n=1 Tax=Kitasatospora sp. CB02891 TaxID=2020329 RepID=UPI000C27DC16|nr:acyl carrier protein [Kitasatospora sp. CB02891]PJN25566.1 phosphopantetheine-binding protein [Kitasatospora sp. CB02891]